MKNLLIVFAFIAIVAFGNVAMAHHHYYGGGVYVSPVYVAPAPVYVVPAPVYIQPAPVYVIPQPIFAPNPYYVPAPIYPRGAVIVGGRSWGVRVGW